MLKYDCLLGYYFIIQCSAGLSTFSPLDRCKGLPFGTCLAADQYVDLEYVRASSTSTVRPAQMRVATGRMCRLTRGRLR
jgi:hypothetical protein